LLAKIVEIIRKQPENWNQDLWAYAPGDFQSERFGSPATEVPPACDTTLCVAGWAAHLTGAKLDWVYTRNGLRASTVNNGDQMISKYAKHVLELSSDEADHLFYGVDELDEIDAMARGTWVQQ